MIELPPDLAEVLKVVQSNEHGAGVLFPDANEDLLEELAAAWEAWNTAAEPAVRTIVASANRAMSNMSGEAADSFQSYLHKYAGSDQSHATTTLEASTSMAQTMRGAQQAVVQTKSEMVRELQYAKEYMEQNPAGKHDDIAQSEGIKTAADTYNTYVGHVGSDVDTMLRQSAGQVERMTSAGQVARLGGSGGSGGSGTASPTSATVHGAALDPSTLLQPTATGLDSLPAGATLPGSGIPGADVGTLSAPFDPAAAGLPSGAPGADFGGGMPDGSGAAAGAAGGGGSAYRPQLGSLQPFQPPAPVPFTGGGGGGGGGGSFGSGGGTPVFSPDGSPKLGLAGLGDLPSTIGGGGGGGGGSALAPWNPPTPNGPTFGGPGPGTIAGMPFGNLGGSFGNPSGVRPTTGAFKPFGSGNTGGGAFKPSGVGGGAFKPSGAGGAGGGAFKPSGLGGAGGASARGMTTRAGLGGAGAAGEGGLRSGAGTTQGGTGIGRAGAAGTAGATRTTGQTGMAGAHGPGGMGAGGKGDKRGGNRFVRPTRFGSEGPEDEEETLLGDSGITGQAARHEEGDRRWERMRRRWLDAARTDGPPPQADTAAVGADTPAEQNALLTQLTTALLGPDAGADGAAALAGTDGASTDDASGTGAGTATGDTGRPAATDSASAGGDGGSGAAATSDEDYLDRARTVAARRGRPDADTPAASSASTTGEGGAGAAPERAPLREEGGYQVPSPFLRAALARLATSGGADGAAPGGAAGS